MDSIKNRRKCFFLDFSVLWSSIVVLCSDTVYIPCIPYWYNLPMLTRSVALAKSAWNVGKQPRYFGLTEGCHFLGSTPLDHCPSTKLSPCNCYELTSIHDITGLAEKWRSKAGKRLSTHFVRSIGNSTIYPCVFISLRPRHIKSEQIDSNSLWVNCNH